MPAAVQRQARNKEELRLALLAALIAQAKQVGALHDAELPSAAALWQWRGKAGPSAGGPPQIQHL